MNDDLTSNVSIARLQAIQLAFDKGKGFDFSDFYESIEAFQHGLSDLQALQFTSLALAGEVGEFANKVKKISRSKMLDCEIDVDHSVLKEELGDIFAYLLKLSGLLDGSIAENYLEKMCFNALRFSSNNHSHKRLITLAGASGAGKTTLANALAKKNIVGKAYIEDTSSNPYFSAFRQENDKPDYFASQLWFLNSQVEFFLKSKDEETILLDQDPNPIVTIYGKYLYENGKLDSVQYEELLSRLIEFENQIALSGFRRDIVYLSMNQDLATERLRIRDGDSAPNFYLVSKFDEYFSRIESKLLIDCSKGGDPLIEYVVESLNIR